jgi:hypothetical protein
MAATAAPTVTREPLTRAIRSVDVVFDVISFPAGLHGAVADQDVRLESFCDNGHAPTKVRQTTSCPACSNDDRDSWRKGKERGGEITLVPKDEYEAIKAKIEDFKGKVEIKVVEANDELMVPAGDVYYLATKNARAGSGYPLLAALIPQAAQGRVPHGTVHGRGPATVPTTRGPRRHRSARAREARGASRTPYRHGHGTTSGGREARRGAGRRVARTLRPRHVPQPAHRGCGRVDREGPPGRGRRTGRRLGGGPP